MTKKIFISHSSQDRPLVDLFVDLLDTGCGLARSNIFCTSLEGMGVPAGKDFLEFIRENLVNPSFVILMLSKSYYDSVFCLCELGTSWAISNSIFPIIIPPLKKKDVKDVLSVTQLGLITKKAYLDELRDKVVDEYEIKNSSTATWNVKRDKFLEDIPGVLDKLPQNSRVSAEQYLELRKAYKKEKQAYQKANDEIDKLKELIEELKECKDAEEVANITKEHNTEWEQFESLSDSVQKKLHKLPNIVSEAIYYHFRGQQLVIVNPFEERDQLNRAQEAEEEGYLIADEMSFDPNSKDRRVSDAISKVDELSNFLREVEESEFAEQFYEQYDYEPSIDNKRFWRDQFDINI